MALDKELLEGFKINIFTAFFVIWQTKRKISKFGEKTAHNYTKLADAYSTLERSRTSLYYALKAIRIERNYAPAYTIAGAEYIDSKQLAKKYLKKAIELGGEEYYLPQFLLSIVYFCGADYANAYIGITKFLQKKANKPQYQGFATILILLYYGYSVEYKLAIHKYLKLIFTKGNKYPFFSSLVLAIFAEIMFLLYYPIITRNNKFITTSVLLNSLDSCGDYENALTLANKILIKGSKRKDIANIYYIKANAYANKEEPELEKANKSLEKWKNLTKNPDKETYYQLKANYAFYAEDYKKALLYQNKSLLCIANSDKYLYKASICNQIGEYEESKKANLKAMEYEDYDKNSGYFCFAESLYKLGELEEALSYINKSLLVEQTPGKYSLKARILEQLNKTDEAKICEEKAKKLEEEDK